ncbi:hypothetical protein CR164_07435 [Prosthecochloris marina]|uniref:Uncharacterized protein n=1 Tax=Prosthecochloris marina TaxID=2017681 RepID=A0A317T8U3_9CHLB|nr:hypothetical protein CR164_07435 [Prosthecochloris marina]
MKNKGGSGQFFRIRFKKNICDRNTALDLRYVPLFEWLIDYDGKCNVVSIQERVVNSRFLCF